MKSTELAVLDESKNYILFHEYEDAFLVEKSSNKRIHVGSHYGNPRVGVISSDEKAAVVAGDGITCYVAGNGTKILFRKGYPPLGADSKEQCWFVHDVKFETSDIVLVLIDPLSEFASRWRVNLAELSVQKLSDGPYLTGFPDRGNLDS